MELHKSVSSLTTKIERLSEDISGFGKRLDTFGEKIDAVKRWQHIVSGGAIVVAAVVAAAWAVITFVPWNRVHIDAAPPGAEPPKT